MAEKSAHGTWGVFCLLFDRSHAWDIQSGQPTVDRGGGIGILVFLFLPYQHFIFPAFF